MASTEQNFTMWAGDDVNVVVTVVDSDGNTVDITGASIEWVMQERVDSSSADVTKTTTGGGITLTDAANGEFTIALDPDDTADLAGRYYHEAELTLSGNVVTVCVGYVEVHPSAT